jgi:Tfp pilus assembly protein PilF
MIKNIDFFAEAKGYAKKGEFKLALEKYKEALKEEPSNPLIYQEMASVLHYLGQNNEAVAYGEEAISLNYNLVWAHNWTGMAYDALGKLDDAIRHYDCTISIAKKQGDNYEAANGHKYKAQTLIKQQKYDEAFKNNEEAIKLTPYITYYLDRADIYKAIGDDKGALEVYTEVTNKWPTDFFGYFRKGEVLKKMGNSSDALKDFIKASELIKLGYKGQVAFSNQLKSYLEKFDSTITNINKELASITDNIIMQNPEAKEKILEANNKISKVLLSVTEQKSSDKPPSQDEIMKALVSKLQLLESQNEFKDALIMQMMERLEKLESKQVEKEQKLYCVTEVIYDNDLLNHPELLKLSVKELGISRVLDMSNSLSSELISEAIGQNNAELLLAGCISLDCSDII